MSQPVSLIFINWNTADLVFSAVRSLASFAGNDDCFQTIVVDNGSSDDSLSRFHGELNELLETYSWHESLKILDLKRNTGFAYAVNRGLEAAEDAGSVFALVLNTDVEFHDNAPTRLVDALKMDELAILACPRLLRPDGSEQPAATPLPTIVHELTNRSLPRKLLLKKLSATDTSVVPSVVGPCMAVHLERLKTIGHLDERFFFFFEETDWCKRITESGHHVIWVPDIEVVHMQGATANTRPFKARVQFFESRYLYYEKHNGRIAGMGLKLGLLLRVVINMIGSGLLAILSIGSRKHRDKAAVYAHLVKWHLAGCPKGWSYDTRG